MPISTQRLSRHAWQWRLLSLVMVQLPLKGHVKEALRFILRLNKSKTVCWNVLKQIQWNKCVERHRKTSNLTKICVIKILLLIKLPVKQKYKKYIVKCTNNVKRVLLPLKPERNRLHKQAKYGTVPRNLGLKYAKQWRQAYNSVSNGHVYVNNYTQMWDKHACEGSNKG